MKAGCTAAGLILFLVSTSQASPSSYTSYTSYTSYFAQPDPATFAQRCQAYLEYHAEKPGHGPIAEAALILQGFDPDLDCIDAARRHMDDRIDGSDCKLVFPKTGGAEP